MKQLSEIVRVVSRFETPTHAHFRTQAKNATDLASELYIGVRNGRFKTEFDAAGQLLDSTPQDSRFRVLKSRARRRALDSLFHLNLRKAGYSDYTRIQYWCNKTLFLVSALVVLGARNTARALAKSVLRKALDNHLTLQVLQASQVLRETASLTKNGSSFAEYKQIHRQWLRYLQAEAYATSAVEEWEFVQDHPAQVHAFVRERLEELDKLQADCSTYNFILANARFRVVAAHSSSDLQEVVSICEGIDAFYTSAPQFSTPIRRAEFLVRKLEALLYLRDYEYGKATANLCSELIPVGSTNFFYYTDRYFQLLAHTRHFEEARATLEAVIEHPSFGNLAHPVKEKWWINRFYVLYATEKLTDDPRIRRAKAGDLLSSIQKVAPTLSKDKHGPNISLLIIHILYLLEVGDFDAIVDRMEALRTYRSRYLRPNTNPQSALFFKLLTIMENNAFDYKLTKQKAAPHFDKLKAMAADPEEIREGLQILPYDWLWPRMLEKLRQFEQKS